MVQGECHCGNIQLKIPKLSDTGTSCTCSICSKYAAIWGYFKESEIAISVGNGGLSTYCHGDKLLSFNRCKVCGCVTHFTSTPRNTDSRFAVNYRLFPASTLKKIKVRLFDGADTWKYID